jgi:uncharacterized membrane protein
MFELMLFLHLVTAIFLVGPLVHFATTAARGLRENDAAATASSARGAKIYANVSVLVLIFGFGLMSMDSPYRDGKVAQISDPFIWVSTILALVAVGLVLGLLVPTLEKATTAIRNGEAVGHLKGKVAASGGVVGLIFLVIVWLMVYKPGS